MKLWKRAAAEKALGHDPLGPVPRPTAHPTPYTPRPGSVHYPLPDVSGKPPGWAEPLAPPAPWGRHLRG